MSFKETEVGRIPEQWEVVILEDFIQFNPRESLKIGTLSKKIGMNMLNPFTKKIQGYEEIEFKSGTKFRNGDTLLARITPCLENGKTAQVNILDDNEVGFGSTEFIVMREKINKSINDFIYYLSISDKFRDVTIKSMTGTTGRQRAQKDVLEKTRMALPPMNEQKAIANILSTLDEKIEINNQINKNLETMASEIFKHWFVDFEFPDENGNPYKSSGGKMAESELGMIPEGCEVLTLNDASNLSAGGDKPGIASEVKTDNCQVPIYSNGISKNGLYGYTDTAKINEESVTVSARGTIGFVCLRREPFVPIVRLITLIPKTEYISAKYLYFAIKQMNILGTGTTQQQLTVPAFKTSPILIPMINIMEKYTEIINAMFDQIDANDIENQNLINLRNTLLPKLMSGEIRVPLED